MEGAPFVLSPEAVVPESLSLVRLQRCPPERVARHGRALLAAVEAGGPPTLAVIELKGEALLLGRHQRGRSALNLEAVTAAGLPVHRRLGGGRALRVGEGVVAVLLALPAPSALLEAPIGPEKALNRHVRGLLPALTKLSDVAVAYFGRDVLIARLRAGSRRLAIVSQETTPTGAVLIEAWVQVRGDATLPPPLSGYLPHGDPEHAGPPAITLRELTARKPSFDELVDAIADGFHTSHGVEVVHRDLQSLAAPEAPGEPVFEEEEGLGWSGLCDVPIGFVEALARAEGGRVREVRLRGDFLAPAFVREGLERALVGEAPAFEALGRVTNEWFARPFASSLGLTRLRVFPDAVLAAL